MLREVYAETTGRGRILCAGRQRCWWFILTPRNPSLPVPGALWNFLFELG